MLFRYTATDQVGAPHEGTIDAANIDTAISSLQRRGYVVSSIDPITEKHSMFEMNFHFLERISNKEIVIFSRQIATLFEAQVSALRIFRLLAAEAENPLMRRILTEVSDALQGGTSISNSLAQHPEAFSPFYVSMVKAGEESGKLDEVFLFLADYLDRTYEVMSKARNAMIYPAFVVVTFVGVMTLMMTMVIPKISEILLQAGQVVPIYTKVIIAMSMFMTKYIGLLLLLVSAGGFVVWRFTKTEVGMRTVDELKISLPYIGDLYRKLYLSRVSDSLSTMLASGISMVAALEIAAQVVGNRVFKEVIENAILEVKAGKALSDSFSESPNIPGVMVQMMRVGEESGTLGNILNTLAKFYRREVDAAVDTLVGLIEPAMIVVLGVGVAILLAAVLVPIYNVSTSI